MKRKIISVILLNAMVFFALVTVHEIAHVGVGMLLGCEFGKAVLFDAKMAGPYAEMACTNASQLVLYGSSLLATASFGLLFLTLKSPGKNLFFVIFGFSLIFSSLDIGLATMETVVYPLIAAGFGFVVLGEYCIASSCINDNLFFEMFDARE